MVVNLNTRIDTNLPKCLCDARKAKRRTRKKGGGGGGSGGVHAWYSKRVSIVITVPSYMVTYCVTHCKTVCEFHLLTQYVIFSLAHPCCHEICIESNNMLDILHFRSL